jgi:adenosylhomocysteinase
VKDFKIADVTLAPSGHKKLDWAWSYMPVLRSLREKYLSSKPFEGHTIAACLHLEAKTACLLRVLSDLGATVYAAGSNPLSTQDDVCAALVDSGVHVYSHHGMDSEAYFANIREVIDHSPSIIIDDGADLVAMIHEERQDLIPSILGGNEETTSGVKRLRAMDKEGVLSFPMISVNDAKSKYLFDNRYGTGQSVWDAIMRSTNLLVAGKNVVVAGYGWCGRGVAMRASALGAHVTVVEVDPHKAFEALMDGYEVMSMDQAAPLGDVFLTLTGNIRVIRREHFELMKDGVILGNAGHFDVEISIPDLEDISSKKYIARSALETYVMEDGRRIHLLASGRLVNLAAGDGHPVEIMDLSFATQLECAIFVKDAGLEPGLYDVPENIDRYIMETRLASMGIELETLTMEQQEYLQSWKE